MTWLIEGMTEEEVEVAIFESLLKQGCPPEIAAKKAADSHKAMKAAFPN